MAAEEHSESIAPLLFLGVVESAFNKVLAGYPQGLLALSRYEGSVLHITTHGPALSCYVILCADAIQLRRQYDGHVDAHIVAPAGQLALSLFGPQLGQETTDGVVEITGDRALVRLLLTLAEELNVWHCMRRWLEQWLPKHTGLHSILDALLRFDPVWMERLQQLPGLVNEALYEIRQQGVLHKEQLTELKAIRVALEQQQRTNMLQVCVGASLLGISWLTSLGVLQFTWLQHVPRESLLLGAVGLVLVLSKVTLTRLR